MKNSDPVTSYSTAASTTDEVNLGNAGTRWKDASKKRGDVVAKIKRTPEYTLTLINNKKAGAGCVIQAPDPTDMEISKRAWEKSVKEWRDELRVFFEHYQTNIERLWFKGAINDEWC